MLASMHADIDFGDLPHALQIVCPLPARLHNGVVVVPQLAQLVAVTPTLCSFLVLLTEFFRGRGELDPAGLWEFWGGSRGDGVIEEPLAMDGSRLEVVAKWGEAIRFFPIAVGGSVVLFDTAPMDTSVMAVSRSLC